MVFWCLWGYLLSHKPNGECKFFFPNSYSIRFWWFALLFGHSLLLFRSVANLTLEVFCRFTMLWNLIFRHMPSYYKVDWTIHMFLSFFSFLYHLLSSPKSFPCFTPGGPDPGRRSLCALGAAVHGWLRALLRRDAAASAETHPLPLSAGGGDGNWDELTNGEVGVNVTGITGVTLW